MAIAVFLFFIIIIFFKLRIGVMVHPVLKALGDFFET